MSKWNICVINDQKQQVFSKLRYDAVIDKIEKKQFQYKLSDSLNVW